MSNSRSTSRRAWVPMRLIIWPPLPITMPFCPSRSTMMVARIEASPSLRQSMSSQMTPTECGTSCRRLFSTFSRTNSATSSSSVASQSMSSGNHRGPSGRCSPTRLTNESTLKPSFAEMTMASSNFASADAASSCALTWSGLARSAFVITSSLKGALEAATCFATHSSPLPTGFVASTRNATTSTSPSSPSATLFSSLPRASFGLCRPGVSTITNCELGVFTTARMRLRVVCATGLVMASLPPTAAFKSVDLPTDGRPTSATNPLLNGASFFSPFASFSMERPPWVIVCLHPWPPSGPWRAILQAPITFLCRA